MQKEQLKDGYSFPGFYPLSGIESFPGNPQGKIICLKRRQKKQYVGHVEQFITLGMIRKPSLFVTCLAANFKYICKLMFGEFFVRSVKT